MKYVGKKFVYVTNPDALEHILTDCFQCSAIGIDVETTKRRDLNPEFKWNEQIFPPGLDPFVSEVRLLQLATFKTVYVIDLWFCPDVSIFESLMMCEYILKIGCNLKFDIKMLMYQLGWDFRNIFDVMLASQLITVGLSEYFRKHSLAAITQRELGITLDKTNQKSDWGAEKLSLEQIEYAAVDVDVLHDLCLSLSAKMRPKDFVINSLTGETLNLLPVMKIENNACIATARLELDGVYVDKLIWDDVDTDIRIEYMRVRDEISKLVGGINLESPKQVREAFAKMGVIVESTDGDTLEALSKTVPFAKLMTDYRSLAKLLSSYGNGIPGKARRKTTNGESVYFIERIHPITGRIHASFGQILTETARYNCDKPNIQNVVGMEKAKFRTAFRGQTIEGVQNDFIIADLEQFETRALCHVANDASLRAIILDRSTDTHTRTASMMYNVPEDTIMSRNPTTGKKEPGPNYWMRQAAKAIAFGLAYGRGPQSLAEQLGVSIDEARKAIRLYFQTYPDIDVWLKRTAYSGVQNHYILDPIGRIRWFEFDASSSKERGGVGRESKNTPIQSVNADVIKIALFKVHCRFPYGGPVKIVNIVHDEIDAEAPPHMSKEVAAIIKQLMEDAGNELITTVPILADACIGEHWGVK